MEALSNEMKLPLVEVWEVASFYDHFDLIKDNETPPPKKTIRVCNSLSCFLNGSSNLIKELNKKDHGLILIVDEMGKFLDYASSVGSDLNLFQEIAENFSNARLNKEGEPIFIGILHQPFEEYASNLGRSVAEDWQKIQGRFEDIPFSINSEETANLIEKAIKQKKLDSNFGKLANQK